MKSLTDAEVRRILAVKASTLQAESARRYRERLKARGLCVNGATHGAPEAGKTKCPRCLEEQRIRNNKSGPALRAKAKREGICMRCLVRPAQSHGAACDKCRISNARTVRRLRAVARENGMCCTCRCRAISPGFVHCDTCLASGTTRKRRSKQPWCDECCARGFHRVGCKGAA